MLAVSTVGIVGIALVVGAALVVIFCLALKGSQPSERPAIIVALAELVRRQPRDKDDSVQDK